VRPVNGPVPGLFADGDRGGLGAQQGWLSRAITGASAPPDAARMIAPGPRMTPGERLQIYRDGYRGRLVECLADDYAAVRFLLGEGPFEAMAHAYIDEHPSQSPNLNGFGRSMGPFLAERAEAAGAPGVDLFAADLARLEWAIVEAIHAAPSPPLTLDRFEPMTPDEWATARLIPAASVRILRLGHDANAYYQAFRDDARPSAPGPTSSATLVHRKGWVVWRSDLTPAMARLLEAIVAGAPLGEALDTSISDEDEDEGTQAHVTHWFRDWVGGGVFTAVELPEP
jgi:hypothetical protein